MKMTKELTITWAPNSDPAAARLSLASRLFKATEMCLENKTMTHQAVVTGNTFKKFFADQAAVEEYLNFCKSLESRYQTKIDKIEITDI
jgi:hypothetical protein